MNKRTQVWIVFCSIGLSIVAFFLLAGYVAASPPASGYQPLPLAQAGDTGSHGADVLLSTFEWDDYNVAVAYNSQAQEFLAVWSHQGYIYGQRYNVQGEPQGENVPIGEFTGSGQSWPAVAYSISADAYLVVWEDFRNSDQDIYGQRVDADGTLLGSNLSIEALMAGDQVRPDVETDGEDFLVVWQGDQSGTPVIYGHLVEGDGTVIPALHTISQGSGTPCQQPAIAYNSTEDEYLVVFLYGTDPDTEAHGRRVSPFGAPLGSELTIADQHRLDDPDVAAAAWGAYVVVWTDRRDAGTGFNIYGRVVLAGEDNFDGADFVICNATNDQFEPAITRAPSSGQFLAVWQDYRAMTISGWDVYGQRLLPDANLAGLNFVVGDALGDQEVPAVAASQAPDVYLVAWENRAGGVGDIYGQRVAWTGSLLWYQFAISAEPGYQYEAVVAYNSEEEQYLAAWSTEEGAIYAQRLNADGLPIEGPWPLESAGYNQAPAVGYSDQRNEYVVVWHDLDTDWIEGRWVPPGGDPTDYFVVDTDGGRNPDLAYNGAGGFLIVWESHNDIFSIVLIGDVNKVGGFAEVCTDGSNQVKPAVAYDPEHQQFLVVWEDLRNGPNADLYGRVVLGGGALGGPEFRVAGGSDDIARHTPTLDYNAADDQYLVAYERWTTTNNWDICGQLVSWNGTLAGGELVVWSEAATSTRKNPDLLYVPTANRYYVIWVDSRGGPDSDLYGRWLAADGSPATSILPFFCYTDTQILPVLAYDPDHEQGLAVWTDYRRTTGDVYARLGVLDVAPPTARFLRDPTVGVTGTTFTFNAWPSTDDLTPPGALLARWDWTSNGTWDTAWSLDKVITKTVVTANVYTVTLEVRDLMGFTDIVSAPIWVLNPSVNTPPTATLSVNPTFGAAGTNFQLDASGSSDAQTPAANLEVRWDWENDGDWDTLWSTLKIRQHNYTDAGFHTVRVEVRDGGNLTDAAIQGFLVLPGVPADLEISPGEVKMAPYAVLQFQVTAWDEYSNEMHQPAVAWSVADPFAGAIGPTGLFTAGVTAGLYPDAIVAESDGVTDTASVTVFWPYQTYLPIVLRQDS